MIVLNKAYVHVDGDTDEYDDKDNDIIMTINAATDGFVVEEEQIGRVNVSYIKGWFHRG